MRADWWVGVGAVVGGASYSIWHMWTKHEADKYANPEQVAASYYKFAYDVGVRRLDGLSAREYTAAQLTRLGLRDRVKYIKWGKKRYTLPPVGD